MTGEELFVSSMPKYVIDNTNVADVVERMETYDHFCKSVDETMKICLTELPGMYREFAFCKSEYLILARQSLSADMTEIEMIRFRYISDRITAIGFYIRKYVSWLKDHNEFTIADEMTELQKSLDIKNNDLY